MVTTAAGKPRFFSVSGEVKIGGVTRRSAVCYPIRDESTEKAVLALVAEGRAQTYTEEVRFVTGVAYPMKKKDSSPTWAADPVRPAGALKASSVRGPAKTGSKKG
jgi:hypothetical protein